jgi:hypothetical protein
VGQGLLRDPDAAEHARQFLNPAIRIERPDACSGGPPLLFLVNAQVVVCLRGHLGQMGYAQDLA